MMDESPFPNLALERRKGRGRGEEGGGFKM